MKFKLDENIGQHGVDVLAAAGHDVSTVREQMLGGTPDENLFNVCVNEGRALVTLDRDFGQVLRFPPAKSAGIVVLDLGPRPSRQKLVNKIRDLASLLSDGHDLGGKLWIIEPGRLRIHG